MKNLNIAILIGFVTISLTAANDEGAELYQKLIDKYQSLTSYQDEGVAIYYLGEGEKFKQTIPFKTHFSDPNLVRFEFIRHSPNFTFFKTKYVLWHDGVKSCFYDGKETEEFPKISTIFGCATGISYGIAPKVPSLLMDRGLGAGILRLEKAKLAGEKEINGRQCFHLKVRRRLHWVNIWISKDDILIRRMEENGTEINYDKIAINEEIPKSAFQLNPEKNSSNNHQAPLAKVK